MHHFKTYSTPLDIPYPVQIKAGTTLQQKLDFELKAVIMASRSRIPG